MYMKPFIPNKGVILAASIWRVIDVNAMEGLVISSQVVLVVGGMSQYAIF